MPSSDQYRRIFVLGSGFSKSFCRSMPTLKDLNGRIPSDIGQECPAFRDYCFWLQELCHHQPEYMEIESVATSILSAQIFPGEQERLKHALLRFELLRFIANSMHRLAPLEIGDSLILSAFLESIKNESNRASRDSLLLSFNYDTLIEDQIHQDPHLYETVSMDYGVTIESADRSKQKIQRPYSIDLLKLHGSLNWYTVKGAGAELDLKNICCVEPGDRSFPLYEHENPLFIPMAHAKESFLRGSLFNVLWAKADYYLSHAEELYVIGYGFPKTDGNNIPFLLKHRDRIRKVIVFENEGHTNLTRLQNLFGNEVVSSCDAKCFLKESFTNR